MTILLIALGGALGSVARYLTVTGAARLFGAGFPYGTMIANVLGSALMGLAVVLLIDRIGQDAVRWAPGVTVGFLGGYTTFSAFTLDAYLMLEAGRFGAVIGYVAGSVLLSLLGLAIGITLGRVFG